MEYERLILYLSTNRDNVLSILGFSSIGDDRIYALMYLDDLIQRGLDVIDLRVFLENRLRETAQAEIEAFCKKAPPKDFFDHSFWQETPCSAGKMPTLDCAWNFLFNGILCGNIQMQKVMGVHRQDDIVVYDFHEHKFLPMEDPLHYTKICYGNDFKFALAECWINCETMPPAYVEIAAMNRFLDGKKTVSMVFKDGSLHCIRTRRSTLNAGAIFEYVNGGFEIDMQIETGKKNAPIDIFDFSGLRHGARLHTIDPEVLISVAN